MHLPITHLSALRVLPLRCTIRVYTVNKALPALALNLYPSFRLKYKMGPANLCVTRVTIRTSSLHNLRVLDD